jgi:hypothetical protein
VFLKVIEDFHDSEYYIFSMVIPFRKHRVLIDDVACTIAEVCKWGHSIQDVSDPAFLKYQISVYS